MTKFGGQIGSTRIHIDVMQGFTKHRRSALAVSSYLFAFQAFAFIALILM